MLGTLLATFILYLREVDPIFELLVKSTTANTRLVLQLFLLAIPHVLPFTIPFGVLVGILIGLGRLAADGEITAMRAAGVSSRKVIAPVLLFAAHGDGRRDAGHAAPDALFDPEIHRNQEPVGSHPAQRRHYTARVRGELSQHDSLRGRRSPGRVAQHFRGRRRAAGEARRAGCATRRRDR